MQVQLVSSSRLLIQKGVRNASPAADKCRTSLSNHQRHTTIVMNVVLGLELEFTSMLDPREYRTIMGIITDPFGESIIHIAARRALAQLSQLRTIL